MRRFGDARRARKLTRTANVPGLDREFDPLAHQGQSQPLEPALQRDAHADIERIQRACHITPRPADPCVRGVARHQLIDKPELRGIRKRVLNELLRAIQLVAFVENLTQRQGRQSRYRGMTATKTNAFGEPLLERANGGVRLARKKQRRADAGQQADGAKAVGGAGEDAAYFRGEALEVRS